MINAHSIGSKLNFLSRNRFSQMSFFLLGGFVLPSWKTIYPSFLALPSFLTRNSLSRTFNYAISAAKTAL